MGNIVKAGEEVGKRSGLPAVQPVELTMEVVKKFINPNVTDQEAYFFVQFCKAQNLNPFTKEAYLIKYAGQAEPASIVVGYHNFLKRAEENPAYNGFKAGIIVLDGTNKISYREGSFYLEGEKILGGWCEVLRKDRTTVFRSEVNFLEYVGRKKDGSITKQWKDKPATMIRKVPVAQAHRDAFPSELGRLYVAEEFAAAEEALPTYEMGRRPDIPVPEGMEAFGPPKQAGEAQSGAGAPPEGGSPGEGAPAPQEGTSGAPGGEVKMASEAQLKKIGVLMSHAGKKADDDRHKEAARLLGLQAVPTVDGKESLKGLTSRQASALIDKLEGAGGAG